MVAPAPDAEARLESASAGSGAIARSHRAALSEDSLMIRWSVERICRPLAPAALVGTLGEWRDERSTRPVSAALDSERMEERIEWAQPPAEVPG